MYDCVWVRGGGGTTKHKMDPDEFYKNVNLCISLKHSKLLYLYFSCDQDS